MAWIVNTFIDKEENEDKARVEFEICKNDEGYEELIKNYVHIIDVDKK